MLGYDEGVQDSFVADNNGLGGFCFQPAAYSSHSHSRPAMPISSPQARTSQTRQAYLWTQAHSCVSLSLALLYMHCFFAHFGLLNLRYFFTYDKMKSSIFFAASAATVALATPLDKRTIVETEVVVEYYTVTVTAGEEATTSTTTSVSQPTVFVNGGKHRSWTSKSSTTVVAAPTSTTPDVVYVTSTIVPEVPAASSTVAVEAATTSPVVEEAATTQAASSYVAVPASTSTSAAAASPSDMASTALYAHNLHRANHSASAMEWLDEIATYAETTANSCVFAHDM